MKLRSAPRSAGFTLTEILIAFAVIALLVALLTAAVNQAIVSNRTTMCISHLRQIGVGHAAYIADHNGALIVCATPIKNPSKDAKRWYNMLEPYMGGASDALSPDRPAWQLCPAKRLSYASLYGVGYGWNFQSFGLNLPGVIDPRNPGSENWGSGTTMGSISQPAKTVIIGDSHDAETNFGDWQNYLLYWGGDSNDAKLAKRHRGRGNYLMADGHVESLTLKEVRADNYHLFRRKP